MAFPREQKAALERRIWRLAYLLTGDAGGAAGLVDSVLAAQPEPQKLEPARLDRLIVQHARGLAAINPATNEAKSAALDIAPLPAGPAQAALGAVISMPHQPREAWVLARIDDVDELWMSRAMDCSRTAARNHLAAADEAMNARLGAARDSSIAALKAFADALNPERFIAEERTRRRKLRARRLLITSMIAAILLLGAAAYILNMALLKP